MSKEKKFLFVCGVGRSGTTALCEVLNLHEEIVLGVERYKYLMIGKEFPDNPTSLFDEDRFFAYDPEDTNIRLDSAEYGPVYDAAKLKFKDVTYVGDKTPGLYKKLPALHAGFPDCKVIYILRDATTVANSWQNRASKNRDNWPAKNGFEASVVEWNRSLRIIEKALPQWGDDLILVNYETTFGVDAHTLFPDLLEKLGLSRILNPEIKAFLDKSIEAARRNRDIPKEIVDHVAQNAEWDRFERLKSYI